MCAESAIPEPPRYRLRPCWEEDRNFLWALKRATMRVYIEQTWGRWDETEQTGFFRRSFRCDRWKIVVVDHRDVGLLDVVRSPEELYLASIEILPELQDRGLGTAILRDLLAEAKSIKLPLRLQVLKVNAPALRLYQRLGFQVAAETETHFALLHSA